MGCGGSKSSSSDEQPSLIRQNVRKTGPATFKVVMLGNKAVGKSSLVLRHTQDRFSETHELTIGAAFVSSDLSVPTQRGPSPIRLHIWDTAGEEAYRSMTRFFYRESAAGVVVYDVSSADTFDAVDSWVDDFREQCPDALVVLAGNKCDRADRQVPTSRAKMYAETRGLQLVECSAKMNTNVTHLFEEVGRLLLQQAQSTPGS